MVGQAGVRGVVQDCCGLGSAFFRWECATAGAGSSRGINPFNQPDVEASKLATRKLSSGYEKTGKLADEHPILDEQGLWIFADSENAGALKRALGGETGLVNMLGAHLNRLHEGDYFGLLAYIAMNREHENALEPGRE